MAQKFLIIPRGLVTVTNGDLNTNTGEFVFEGELEEDPHSVVTTEWGTGANVN